MFGGGGGRGGEWGGRNTAGNKDTINVEKLVSSECYSVVVHWSGYVHKRQTKCANAAYTYIKARTYTNVIQHNLI